MDPDGAGGHGLGSAQEGIKEGELPSLSEVIERIGMGPAQIKAVLVGGGVWLADGSELLLISSVTMSVADDWHLGGFERGFVVTAVYMGILVGNLLSGPLGDYYGRRGLILLSYVSIFGMSIISSFAMGFGSLASSRLLVGVAIGLGQPTWNGLGSELTPADWRMATATLAQLLFPLGEIYAALLLMQDDPGLRDAHWRSLLRLGAIPSIVLLLASYLLLPESPSFLVLRGRKGDAQSVLAKMSRDNGGTLASVAFKTPATKPDEEVQMSCLGTARAQMDIVFGKHLLGSTIVVMYSCFVLNLAYFGCLFAFPQVLPLIFEQGSAASALLVGALWEFPGFALAFFIGMHVPRKLAMKIYLVLSLCSFVMFATAAGYPQRTYFMEAVLRVGYYGIKCFLNIGFVIVYQYSVEIYPTEARITGSAVNLASGRLAGMLAPLLFEGLREVTHSTMPFFWTIAGAMVLNFGLVDSLRYETAGVPLPDRTEDLAFTTAVTSSYGSTAGSASTGGAQP